MIYKESMSTFLFCRIISYFTTIDMKKAKHFADKCLSIQGISIIYSYLYFEKSRAVSPCINCLIRKGPDENECREKLTSLSPQISIFVKKLIFQLSNVFLCGPNFSAGLTGNFLHESLFVSRPSVLAQEKRQPLTRTVSTKCKHSFISPINESANEHC